jgi:cysteinyl-tRNA synthetase
MHNRIVRNAEEKMAKSVGNNIQQNQALDRYGGEAVVAYLVSGHYRQPLEFSDEALTEAAARVERIRNYAREAPGGEPDPFVLKQRDEFLDALADDFNTPRAMAALFDLVAEGNRRPLSGSREALEELLPLVGMESVLEAEAVADPEAEALLAEREAAREAREFERADEIRDQLADRGWEVRDTSAGARLVRRP